jgi:hypothetical protein
MAQARIHSRSRHRRVSRPVTGPNQVRALLHHLSFLSELLFCKAMLRMQLLTK